MIESVIPTITPESPILITGGTGFVGSHLVEELKAKGFTNIFVTNYSADAGYVGTLLSADHILTADLTKKDETFSVVERVKPQWIFHLAAIAVVGQSFEQAATIFQNNTLLQLNVLEAMREHVPQARILVIGSGMEYGIVPKLFEQHLGSTQQLDRIDSEGIDEETTLRPTSPYAVSKVTQDLLGLSYAYSYNLDVVRVRPFNHIGERQTTDFAIPAFASQIVAIEQGKQQKIQVGSLEAIRDICDVKDVVKSYILLMQKGQAKEVYNVGGGVGYTMQSILAKMCSLSTVHIPIETDPARFRPIDVPIAIADIRKIKSIGWIPTITLDESLKRVLEEWRGKY